MDAPITQLARDDFAGRSIHPEVNEIVLRDFP